MPNPNDLEWQMRMAEALARGGVNIGTEEDELEKQQAIADSLRFRPTQRMDWASQAARGIGGITGAMMDKRNTEQRRSLGQSVVDALRAGRPGLGGAGSASKYYDPAYGAFDPDKLGGW